ncbi:metallophosphoesterase [Acidiphilium sp. AL]|uniref:Metallophosphoesterase n=1 Tax=Acidiphilium iwatense TaxID=768198 RepID=A0ABS9DVY2_9PROT|nr:MULTISPECIES: metallophosphoesterase [Acidiphilium]MCF3945940.1 metallophosphoesterase [Acidiphilium iwatense]MCU4159179.1 metallophosphoesterase [Acidiphilium sp. AL]
MIPHGVPLRIVGDVHGDSHGFAAAVATDRFIVQLGDLVDDGMDTPGVLHIMFRLIDEGRGIFLLGNHDFKLARALRGDAVQRGPALATTLTSLDTATASRALHEITRAPAWIATAKAMFVHGGFHPAMLTSQPPPFPAGRPGKLLARALYGQTTGRTTGAGKPERLLAWIETIPSGMTVYCGHDQRSTNGRPFTLNNPAGGSAIFLDTGAGKGGHLSWIDISLRSPVVSLRDARSDSSDD